MAIRLLKIVPVSAMEEYKDVHDDSGEFNDFHFCQHGMPLKFKDVIFYMSISMMMLMMSILLTMMSHGMSII